MPNNPIHDADQETLSALFDGQLEGDAARFALKRLGDDAQWRQTCGHWQLAGDVLRGNTGAVAPADFAERVMAAVALESLEAAPVASPHSVASGAMATARRRWIGGAALAASVAMAALFVVRPLSQTAAPTLETSAQQIAADISAANSSPSAAEPSGVTPAAPTLQVASVPQATVPEPTSVGGVAQLATAAAIAAAELPRRAGERRSRGQSQRATGRRAARATQTQVAAAASVSPVSATMTVAGAAGPSLRPFQPRDEIASRPWPRAMSSDYPGAGGSLTASYGGVEGIDPSSPSFYPFEPQALQAASDASRSDWPQPAD